MEDFNYSQRQAIRAWVVDRAFLIFDNNDRELRETLTVAAIDGILNGMGTGYTREHYSADPSEARRVVGIYVTDALSEWLADQEMPDIIRTVLGDLLDLGDSAQRDMIGEHYLPNADDVPWDEEEGDNEDDE